ncbi:hypothetical protein SAMN05518683_11265 [Salibacterium halotolerans]|uniref:Uncharacterized protein n=1 Tax=Salibacterium halotolerans TaxID=1884432 RepID=A0A1I5U404_9BACI|nr:hypothetical protein SAMN05518683_11265 [Salibacterium halotolerans]
MVRLFFSKENAAELFKAARSASEEPGCGHYLRKIKEKCLSITV